MSSVYDNQLKGEGPIGSIPSGTSATGPGATIAWVVPRMNHTMYTVSGATGVPAGGVVAMEISPDGQKWVTTGITGTASGVTGGVSYATYSSAAAKYVRANVTTAFTGGTVAVYFYGV